MACGGNRLEKVLDLGAQPLANSFLDKPEKLEEYPLEINLCHDCAHGQLSLAVDPDLLYRHYKYVSGTTQTLKDHFTALASEEYLRAATPQPWALDIGCNDGTLMEALRGRGFTVLGVDPAENLRELTKAKNLLVHVDYWDQYAAFNVQYDFDLITALNCLAHNANPYSFLKGCKRVLRPGGRILLEFPYFPSTIEKTDLGQFYAEHHSYFTAQSIIALAERLNLTVIEATMFPSIHGGTIRIILTNTPGGHCREIRQLAANEMGIFLKIKSFADRINETATALASIGKTHPEVYGLKMVAYGASAKSSTLFNLPQLRDWSRVRISHVVDDSPLKQGLYCPGSNLYITSPDELMEENPEDLVILLTVHNFKSEVVKKLKILGLGPAHLLNYTPEIKLERVDEA